MAAGNFHMKVSFFTFFSVFDPNFDSKFCQNTYEIDFFALIMLILFKTVVNLSLLIFSLISKKMLKFLK